MVGKKLKSLLTNAYQEWRNSRKLISNQLEVSQQILRNKVLQIKKEETFDGMSKSWVKHNKTLQSKILKSPTKDFLSWKPIRKTMFVADDIRIVQFELPYLMTKGWLTKISEDLVGNPKLIRGTNLSQNLVHHAYHLAKFEEFSKKKISEFQEFVEVGAGYGSMARLIHRVHGNTPNITLFDTRIFSALQAFFLNQLNISVKCVSSLDDVRTNSSSTLFISTWALSEMPLNVRGESLSLLRGSAAFLIAYQDEFEGIDNDKYFRDKLENQPEFQVIWVEIDHLPGNRYIFGLKREID